jgi:hypothetical protein
VRIPDHGALQRLRPDEFRKLSHLMAGLTRDAQIRIYPDAAHAFRLQEPEQVAADINAFLASPTTAASSALGSDRIAYLSWTMASAFLPGSMTYATHATPTSATPSSSVLSPGWS